MQNKLAKHKKWQDSPLCLLPPSPFKNCNKIHTQLKQIKCTDLSLSLSLTLFPSHIRSISNYIFHWLFQYPISIPSQSRKLQAAQQQQQQQIQKKNKTQDTKKQNTKNRKKVKRQKQKQREKRENVRKICVFSCERGSVWLRWLRGDDCASCASCTVSLLHLKRERAGERGRAGERARGSGSGRGRARARTSYVAQWDRSVKWWTWGDIYNPTTYIYSSARSTEESN